MSPGASVLSPFMNVLLLQAKGCKKSSNAQHAPHTPSISPKWGVGASFYRVIGGAQRSNSRAWVSEQ
jgi:hypothetical protein